MHFFFWEVKFEVFYLTMFTNSIQWKTQRENKAHVLQLPFHIWNWSWKPLRFVYEPASSFKDYSMECCACHEVCYQNHRDTCRSYVLFVTHEGTSPPTMWNCEFSLQLWQGAAVCPHLEKGAVLSLSVLKNSVLLNLKIIGCHQNKAGINWKIKALFLSVSHNLFCCLVAVVYTVAS